jgi:hypothetical protein
LAEILANQLSSKITNDTDKAIFTRQETASLIHISLPTLNDYTKRGLIKGSRLGTKVLYKIQDIQEALVQIKTRVK